MGLWFSEPNPDEHITAAAYIRVSTDLQAESGLSLEHQEKTAREAIEKHGWELGLICEEVISSTKPIKKRRKLNRLLEDLDKGEYDVLLVTRLDRLCRSGREFLNIVHRSQEYDWQIVCLDPPLDLTSPYGKMMAGMFALCAELEVELTRQRTREAMAVRKQKGLPVGGMPAFSDGITIDAICRLKSQGKSNRQIASILTMEGVPTSRGGIWYPETVRRVHQRAEAARGDE
jgi:DNA invertase Pin-like site-specific DNA recombinase